MQSYIKTKFAQIFLIFHVFKIHSSAFYQYDLTKLWAEEASDA